MNYHSPMAQIFVALAGAIHVYIFTMESLFWGRPRTNKVFGLSREQAEQNRLFAFNQGYYNLFLAIAAFAGIAFAALDHPAAGAALMAYALLSMLGVSLVLLYSNKKLIRPAIIQGLPPLLGLIFLALH
jgi:putative membrane protein